MRRTIIGGEKASDTTYLLLTEGNYAYRYKFVDAICETFTKEDLHWRNMVIEGQQILLNWIVNPIGESPAYICWNFEGKAMLEVKLRSAANIERYTNFGCEINPFEYPTGKWVVDETHRQ